MDGNYDGLVGRSRQMTDPVVYTVLVRHWQDGEIDVQVRDAGRTDSDRASIAYALRQAADRVENGQVVETQ